MSGREEVKNHPEVQPDTVTEVGVVNKEFVPDSTAEDK